MPIVRLSIIASVLMCLSIMLGAGAVYAQSIETRLSQQERYDRIVFEWPTKINYTADVISPGVMAVTFNEEANVNLRPFSQSRMTYLNSVTEDAATAPETTRILLSGEAGTNFRHFRIGTKIIIDVSGKKLREVEEDAPPKPAPEAATQAQSPNAPNPTPRQSLVEQTQERIEKPDLASTGPSETAEEDQSFDTTQPSVITVSSTARFGLASYVRFGYLNLLIDKPGITLPPQVEGPIKDILTAPERIDLGNATLFRYELPRVSGKQYYFRAEGGGLLWRIIISDYQTDLETASLQVRQSGAGKQFFSDMPASAGSITYQEPKTGLTMHAVPVMRATSRLNIDRALVDFEVVKALTGAVIIEKRPPLDVAARENGDGFTISKGAGSDFLISEDALGIYGGSVSDQGFEPEEDSGKVFYFSRWAGEGMASLGDTRMALETKLAEVEEGSDEYTETILSLAKLHLANYMPQEALGYFRYATNALAPIEDTQEFLAMRGAAQALSGKSLAAQSDLMREELANIPEVRYWQAYNLGRLERWDLAYETMPKNPLYIRNYTVPMKYEVALMLAETALRNNDQVAANNYMSLMRPELDQMGPSHLSYYRYLEGELKRQEGQLEAALNIWKTLLEEGDKLFRAKAGVTYVRLGQREGKLTAEEAIEILDPLRFTWRQDGLESQLAYTLGLAFIDNGQYREGLTLLRDTVSITENDDERAEIVSEMQNAFNSLFIGERAKDLSPIQAVALFESFSELVPAGREGDDIILALIDRLVEVDLINRASALMEDMIENRVTGDRRLDMILELAKLHLAAGEPQDALDTVDYISDSDLRRNRKIRKPYAIIKAKAMSELGEPEEALRFASRIGEEEEVYQLRADIAWSNQEWERAAQALNQLIEKRGLEFEKPPLSPENSKIVLNTAVAINLTGNTEELQKFQKRFEDVMEGSEHERLFKIVTRPPGTTFLANRESILEIVNEVDIFQEILDQF